MNIQNLTFPGPLVTTPCPSSPAWIRHSHSDHTCSSSRLSLLLLLLFTLGIPPKIRDGDGAARKNDGLNEKLREFEECQTQLGRARENLDELEGYQNQELGKIKHMLLSAETALDKETQERKRLEKVLREKESQLEGLAAKNDVEKAKADAEDRLAEVRRECDERVAEVARECEAKVLRLEERLSNQDLTGDDRLEAVIKEVQKWEKLALLHDANSGLISARFVGRRTSRCKR